MKFIQVESLVFVVVPCGRDLDAFNNNAMCNLTLSETKNLLPILISDDGQDKTWFCRLPNKKEIVMTCAKQHATWLMAMCHWHSQKIVKSTQVALWQLTTHSTSAICEPTSEEVLIHELFQRLDALGIWEVGWIRWCFKSNWQGVQPVGWRWCTKPTIWKRMLLYPL